MTAALIASAKKMTPAIDSLTSHSRDSHQALRESFCSCCTWSGSRRIREGARTTGWRRMFERLITRVCLRARAYRSVTSACASGGQRLSLGATSRFSMKPRAWNQSLAFSLNRKKATTSKTTRLTAIAAFIGEI